MTATMWAQADGYAECAGRDMDRSAWSSVPVQSGPMGSSTHHRQLRSRGGKHAPSNLVTLTGSGTTGEHGWVHANPAIATVLGYMVNSWDEPAEIPIFRVAPYGPGYGWYLQDDEAQLTPCPPPTDRHTPDEIVDALIAFDEIYLTSRRDANPFRL
ncbi:hypothetical protein [Leucobacter salsicius]|uniref:hypothetical protein n=1 Tax=Leucobacter salsicius TaxID=664638 RepID=UPI0003490AAB|nr:hypothetical protein [Leucobacter salsicius]